MRVALISDIHGNRIALDAVLADVERRGADQIVCLGDVAAMGPQPAECIARLRELGCPVVKGNTDDLLLHPPAPSDAADEATRLRMETLRWGAGWLSPEDRAFLAGLAPTVEIQFDGGATMLCYHGSPRSFDDIVLPSTPDDELTELFGDVEAMVLAGGHTHVAMVRPFGARLLVNPGSVGMTFFRVPSPIRASPPWAEYGLVAWEAGLASVELRRIPLDREALVHAARKSGPPNAEAWIAGWS